MSLTAEPPVVAPIHGDRIQHLLETARETLHMDIAYVTALDGTEQTFTHLAGDLESFGWEPGTTGPEVDGYCHYVLAGELTNAVPDTFSNPVTSRLAATTVAGIGSYVGVPVTLGGGRVYGALCVAAHRRNHDLGASDVAVMNFLARLIAEEFTELDDVTARRALQQLELDMWLAPGGLTMHVQPIIDLATGAIKGLEALSRFCGHAGSPAEIFTAATEAGLGTELELAAVLLLLPHIPETVYLSVNVSQATVEDPELERILLEAPKGRVMLELTEHVEFTGHPSLVDRLRKLKAHGVRLAIDDAGSGYSGLQIILALSPDVIKLDIALVKGIDQDPVRRSLVKALASFAAETGAMIVAEGIETQRELETLRELGVTLGQGYYLFRPGPLQEFDLADA